MVAVFFRLGLDEEMPMSFSELVQSVTSEISASEAIEDDISNNFDMQLKMQFASSFNQQSRIVDR
jgi:hypothetical protein